ncbi:GAF domain-containing protein [Pseudoalteromonas sp. CO348]|uniref:GAF domain-containing protein n=1 Tax=Pseudoalteromonas TaxID=53246 RepID=UPI001022B946|nr:MULTISPECIES: GAF domain-containing protein [Pseudoalteromonas]QZO14819.1 GAF domain-containing protein [Pseudoalteromonas piscicida]RZG00517.1 GAF domain-containing protein [Pseudoalteromonas sp. CO348]
MKIPELPENEHARLHALRELAILDTKPTLELDRITQFTAHVFDAPIALVSLVDKDRQWFKSRFGLDAEQTSRDVSFCGHAILEDTVFVVSDTLEDPRFMDNPLVLNAPNIRFYAGAPIILSSGFRVGTVCVIDIEPRELSEADCEILRQIANDVVTQLEKI